MPFTCCRIPKSRGTRFPRRSLSFLAPCLFAASAAFAQLTTATVIGNIQDVSGAVVPNASVTATNDDTRFTRTVASNAEGAYRLDFLPVGAYTIHV